MLGPPTQFRVPSTKSPTLVTTLTSAKKSKDREDSELRGGQPPKKAKGIPPNTRGAKLVGLAKKKGPAEQEQAGQQEAVQKIDEHDQAGQERAGEQEAVEVKGVRSLPGHEDAVFASSTPVAKEKVVDWLHKKQSTYSGVGGVKRALFGGLTGQAAQAQASL